MFSSTSALRVVLYTPKVLDHISHKLPAKPSWSNPRKQTVNPLALPKKAPDDSQREKRHTDSGGSIIFRANSILDTKSTGGIFELPRLY